MGRLGEDQYREGIGLRQKIGQKKRRGSRFALDRAGMFMLGRC